MKLSMLWLKEWVAFTLTEKQLADQLTMAGLEVDAVIPVAGSFNQVVVAEVLSTKPHPNADKLTLCQVRAKSDITLQVVCGAANVRAGIKVALAMVGANLPGNFKIKESLLRGEQSCGMLCSLTELGLAEQSDGIMELDEDAPLGMDLREYLNLDDYVMDIDLTPNRADCFSLLGVAREVSVLNNLPLLVPVVSKVSATIQDVLPVHTHAMEACPHYCGRIIRNINPDAKTPSWMRERLERSGIRSLHPVVDVLNYVMIELGQPMHAFDLAQIQGEIQVRFGNSSEELELLDGQLMTLSEDVLVIADSTKPLAIAGIMGGAESAVGPNTQDVFLESAFFNPIAVAGVARKLGLFSDSSQRFERGVDPDLQLKALNRATELLLSIVGGKAAPVIERSESNHLPPAVVIQFDATKVKKITGLDLPTATMKHLLEGLGMGVSQIKDALFEVRVPSHRFDVQMEVDLVEEIIRLYGYDKLEIQPTHSILQAGKTSENELMMMHLASWFRSRGYQETISYSFVEPQLHETLYPDKDMMQLLNPISSDLSQMRSGMWPGLIASMIYNVHRQQNRLKLFEIGVVFDVNLGQLTERPCIAGLLMGEQGAINWSESTRCFDFYDLKGELESLFSSLQIESLEWVAAPHPALHPGQSAKILIKGQEAGWMGVLHPRIADALDIQQEVIVFELTLNRLTGLKPNTYKKISKFPQIRRDLSLLVDEGISAMQIESLVRATIKENWLKAFHVFDVYKGTGIPEGKKSLAIAMILQDDNRTLVDSEINSLTNAIITSLETNFSITLRD